MTRAMSVIVDGHNAYNDILSSDFTPSIGKSLLSWNSRPTSYKELVTEPYQEVTPLQNVNAFSLADA